MFAISTATEPGVAIAIPINIPSTNTAKGVENKRSRRREEHNLTTGRRHERSNCAADMSLLRWTAEDEAESHRADSDGSHAKLASMQFFSTAYETCTIRAKRVLAVTQGENEADLTASD
ncbi:hypothetical protein MRB53_040172 [Persea americana]|nr:hypothetical protein MRB53_040172 [Persea americana]